MFLFSDTDNVSYEATENLARQSELNDIFKKNNFSAAHFIFVSFLDRLTFSSKRLSENKMLDSFAFRRW